MKLLNNPDLITNTSILQLPCEWWWSCCCIVRGRWSGFWCVANFICEL